jgi:hypothetical protein
VEPSLKSCLRALVLEIRHLLEGSYDNAGGWKPGDLEKRLASIGVTRDRSVPADELAQVPPEDREARRVIDAFIESRAEADVGRADAVGEFIQEAAYTWANRLLALRCMEARGFIDEVVLQKESYGGRSLQHYRLSRKEPARCAGEDGGLFSTLFDEFERRARDLPMLFNPKAAAVTLRPSVAVLERCIALLSGTEAPKGQNAATDELFIAPDALGWTYQYWNTEEKKRVDDWLKTKKGFKCEGRDIVPKTCLYTEDYMVKFLVQNSLGRLWMQTHPESKLAERWAYYVRNADRISSAHKPVTEITFLDPACGSGHFLIEAFDLLYAMYEEVGELTKPAEICAAILERNLYGIDIDERAVQIAALALAMKAWEKAPAFAPRRVNLVATNIILGSGNTRLESFLKKHPGDASLKPALVAIFDGLAHANELGSLLQIEEPVETELRYLREKHGAQMTIFGKDGAGDLATWKANVIERLRDDFNADAGGSDLSAAFFGEAGVKGLSLLDLLGRRYDVVAANPPFLGTKKLGPLEKTFLKSFYQDAQYDLYTAFIVRSQQLTASSGYTAVVARSTWLYQKWYKTLRARLLGEGSLGTIALLGAGAFSDLGGDVVDVHLLVTHAPQEHVILIPLQGAENKAIALQHACSNGAFVTRPTNLFQALPAQIISSDVSPELVEIFDRFEPLSAYSRVTDSVVVVSRYLRFIWEVQAEGVRWFNYSKGGAFAKWQGLQYYALDWEFDGCRLKNYVLARYPASKFRLIVKEEDTIGRPGITWTTHASGSFGARVLGTNSIVSSKGPGVFVVPENIGFCLAVLNSHVATYLLRIISPGQEFGYKYVEQLPFPAPESNVISKMGSLCAVVKAKLVSRNLIERGFEPRSMSPVSTTSSLRDQYREFAEEQLALETWLLTAEATIETCVTRTYGISKELGARIFDFTGLPAGALPLVQGYEELPELQLGDLSERLLVPHDNARHKRLEANEIEDVSRSLHAAYESRPRSGTDALEAAESDEEGEAEGEEDSAPLVETRAPIPSDTLLEELCRRVELHPISVYWLLRDLYQKSGAIDLSGFRRFAEDYLSVIVLRILGYRWPRQVHAGEALPDWAEPSGIIPLTSGAGGQQLIARVRDRIAADFGSERVGAIEREFEEIMGKPLAGWLDSDFFKHHVSQFRKRPIAWQLQSEPPSRSAASGKGKNGRKLTRRGAPLFSCLVYYHRLGDGLLETVRVAHIGPLRKSLQTEHSGLSGMKTRTADQDARRAELEVQIEELSEFDRRLETVIEQGFMSPALEKIADQETIDKWTSRDGKAAPRATRDAFIAQERRYDPDVNDGVRVNITPLQKAGVLAADVIASKDLAKAISDRAEWRADERRWCREGKVPRPGWWTA